MQILELPTEVVGDAAHTPFAIVIDQVEVENEVRSLDERLVREFREPILVDDIKAATGAVGIIVHSGTLDVA